jgi:hypothetical protein
MFFKLELPLHNPFRCQPFWRRSAFVVLDNGERVPHFPKPPSSDDLPQGEWAGLENVNPKNFSVAIRSRFSRVQRGMLRLRECWSRLKTVEWLLGVNDLPVTGSTYQEFLKDYNSFSMALLQVLVGQLPGKLPIPNWKLLILYRFRRCFPEGEYTEDPLSFVSSYETPLEHELYSEDELHKLLHQALSKKNFLITRPRFQAVFSNKASLEYDQFHGGFNATVGCLAQIDSTPWVELPGPLISTSRSYSAMCVARRSRRDKTLFAKSVNTAIALMQSLKRPPIAYVFIIPERSRKARVPTLPEGFCSVLSRYVSGIGKEIQKRLFPVTTSRSAIKMKHVSGSIYLSGDYKDSTSYLGWEVAIVGWYHIFTQAGMEGRELDVHMQIIKFLIGPHQFFSDKSERERYQSIFAYHNRMRPHGKRSDIWNPNLSEKFSMSVDNFKPPLVHVLDRNRQTGMCRIPSGQPHYHVTEEFVEYPLPEGLLDQVRKFRLRSGVVTAMRGLIMAYSIAAPALHLVGAIPHWKFRGVAFVITGDDNASRHPSVDSINRLETEKLRTGMVPHSKKKAARGPRGLLLAEELLVVPEGAKTGDYLRRVKNFPIRILFPQFITDWHAITMPEAAYRNFKEIPDKSVIWKIKGFIYWKFEELYRGLEDMKITIFGENGIFKDHPAPGGYLNSPGGYTYAQVFRRPSQTAPAWTLEAAKALVAYHSEKVTIVQGTSDAIAENSMSEVFLDLESLKNALSYLQVETPYRPTNHVASEPGLLVQVRKNLDLLRMDERPSRRKYGEIGLSYPTEESQSGDWEAKENGRKVKFSSSRGALAFEVPTPADCQKINEETGQLDILSDVDALRDLIMSAEDSLKSLLQDPDFDHIDLDNSLTLLGETAVRSNFRHYALRFTDENPSGTDFRTILASRKHLFIDVANHFGGGRNSPQGLPDLIDWEGEDNEQDVIWFVMEEPGKPSFLRLNDKVYVRATPRRNGRAGADLEFRHLLSVIKPYNPDIRFRSRDRDWHRIFREYNKSKAKA